MFRILTLDLQAVQAEDSRTSDGKSGGKSDGQYDVLCFYENKKDAERPYDHFAGGIAPRSLLCVWKRTISFLPYSAPVFVWPSWSEFIQILRGGIPPSSKGRSTTEGVCLHQLSRRLRNWARDSG